MGFANYSSKPSEQGNIKFRRSLYFVKDLKKGDLITSDSVRSVRPGFGIPPKYLQLVIGKKAKQDIAKNTPVQFNVID